MHPSSHPRTHHPSIQLCMCLSFHLFFCPSTYCTSIQPHIYSSSIHHPIHRPIRHHPSITSSFNRPYVHPSIYLFLYSSSIHPSTIHHHSSIPPFISHPTIFHLLIQPCLYLSLHPSFHPSIQQSCNCSCAVYLFQGVKQIFVQLLSSLSLSSFTLLY